MPTAAAACWMVVELENLGQTEDAGKRNQP